MGKVIISVQMSADGSIGPGMGWFAGGEKDSEAAGQDQLRLADALLGRKTYEGLAAYWPKETGALADTVNGIPKYVVSTSLVEPLECNASLVKGELVEELRRLKADHSGTLLSYGCGELAFNLVKHGLVEELHFWVHPIVWSEPSRPFHGLGHVRMKRKDTTLFDSGVTFHNYEPVSVEQRPLASSADRPSDDPDPAQLG
jgi:dihydrofolate reductase